MLTRPPLAALALALALGVAACGGDEEEPETAASPPATMPSEARSEPAPTETEPGDERPRSEPEPERVPDPATSPEDQPGGAGDEEPARSLALFTATGGQIKPRLVRVPPFISIRVELRSRDGNSYGLTFEGETIEVSDGLGSVSTTLDGLRPGESIVGIPMGAKGRVRIEASAQPGP
jgi:hypothetical protein